MRRKKKYLWMAVTNDEFEFPVFFETSNARLAKKCGISTAQVARLSNKNGFSRKANLKLTKIELY